MGKLWCVFFVSAKTYWAKDLIFLVTSHGHIGMQAWIDQYLGVDSGGGKKKEKNKKKEKKNP